ncbi:hypothetical protein OUZ56_015810 [Daphnia magna]|uniref:Uncharacterized protein n=1 Tax=Daphnia magna TaxID=35525 RepID=A0ABR0ANT3_9CRUS|nr:hypothetical protein OUZ56_015810 [Daphnia magna]
MKKDKSHIDNKLTLCVSSLPFFRPLLLLLLLRENDGPRKRVSSSKSLYEIMQFFNVSENKICIKQKLELKQVKNDTRRARPPVVNNFLLMERGESINSKVVCQQFFLWGSVSSLSSPPRKRERKKTPFALELLAPSY